MTLALVIAEVGVARVLTFDPPAADTDAATPTSVADLAAGDCFNSDAALDEVEVRDVAVVPCSEGHTYEVFALAVHDAGTSAAYPAEDQLAQFAEGECLGAFEGYVGIEISESDFDVHYLYPTPQSWRDGDREVVCVLVDLHDDELDDSARDNGR